MSVRIVILLTALAAPALADDVDKQPLVRAMRDELARASSLKMPGVAAPYYLGYQAIDRDQLTVTASFGALSRRQQSRERYLRTDLRIGDHKFDSSNFFDDNSFGNFELVQIEDDYDAVRREIWHATDRAYKRAAERLEKKRAAHKGQAPDPDRVGDFSPATPARSISTREVKPADIGKLEQLVAAASAVWQPIRELHVGNATIVATTQRRTLVNNEGALVVEPRQIFRFTMWSYTQADDGARLSQQFVTTASSPDGLPTADQLAKTAQRMAADLLAARKAAPAEPYTGPVLFEATAALQLLRALLVDELSGTPAIGSSERFSRMLDKGTSLSDKVGQSILPVDFHVEDDPTIEKLGALTLVGGYQADDEGVAARKVVLVEGGVLKSFLMSRAPRKRFESSNGHGRAGLAGDARGMPSNLIITARKGVSDAELKKKLIAAAKAKKLKYAIIIRQLEEPGVEEGGQRFFFFGGQDEVQLPKPLVIYKVGLDGKEEPIRGLTLGALPLRALRDIVAAGKQQATIAWFGGGAFTGRSIPISFAGPSLLLGDVELVKQTTPQKKPPPLPRP